MMKLRNFWWLTLLIALAAGFCNPNLGVIASVLLLQLFAIGICSILIGAAGRQAARADSGDLVSILRKVNAGALKFVAPACCFVFGLASLIIAEGMWLGFSGLFFDDAPRYIFPWTGMEVENPAELSVILIAVMAAAQLLTMVLSVMWVNGRARKIGNTGAQQPSAVRVEECTE